ncbi:MAG: hypothetical protein GY828_03955, partial [Candidatus Gracilibacteria bacterium]|nr:hypothetical protein [Candidatus Gracilibacteria bacterium]
MKINHIIILIFIFIFTSCTYGKQDITENCKGYITKKDVNILNTNLQKEFNHQEWCELKRLNLFEIKNVTIPPNIGKLVKLEELSFRYTTFNSIPNEINDLYNLRTLEISDSYTLLFNIISNLSNLKELDLSGNNLSEVPDFVSNLSNLKE